MTHPLLPTPEICYARQYFSFVCSVVLCFPALGTPTPDICYACQYFSFVCSVVLCFPILGALCVKHVVRVFLVRCCKSQKWCSRARWRSFLFVLPVLGRVTLSDLFNTSAVEMRFLGLCCGAMFPNTFATPFLLFCGAMFSNTGAL